VTGNDAGNYSVDPTVATSADITPRAITGSITASSKTYDGTATAAIATRTLNGFVNGDKVSYTGGSASFADKNAGAGKTVTATGLSLTGDDAGNYSVNTTATTTADITQLVITGVVTVASKTWDGTTATTVASRSLQGVLASDAANVTLAGGSGNFSDINLGTGKTVTVTGLSLSGTASANYKLSSTSATASADIRPIGLCSAPSYINVATTNSTGNISMYWGTSNVAGVTYHLQYKLGTGSWTDAYTGTTASTIASVPGNGSYQFRIWAHRDGYTDSAITTASAPCVVTLKCGTPAYVNSPTTNSTGNVYMYWGASDVPGVTYRVQYSKEGAAPVDAYQGTAGTATISVPTNGTYKFYVTASKDGYASSDPRISADCGVTLKCGAPPYVNVGSSPSSRNVYVYWGSSDVAGSSYFLEYSSDNGATWSSTISTGTASTVTVPLPAAGTYQIRVHAEKTGYAKGDYTFYRSVTVM
jgi:hypothetical protein